MSVRTVQGRPLQMEMLATENRLEQVVARPPQNVQHHHSPEVLVVDDHPMNRYVVSEMLDALGAHATCAGDGQSALKLARTRSFDLILMDLQMPGLDGYATTRQLLDTPDLDVPPIIGLTASVHCADALQHQAAGLDDCISKPLRPEVLARLLEAACHPALASEAIVPQPNLPDADWDGCLRIAGGREALARDLLVIMLETLAPSVTDIQVAARAYQWTVLAAAVHRLLGACRYTGAPRLTALCERLQVACNRHDRAALLALVDHLEPAAEQFAIAAGELLAHNEAG